MADFNIRVNCIAPGPINTDLLNGITETQIEKITSQQIFHKQFQNLTYVICRALIEKGNVVDQVLNVGGVLMKLLKGLKLSGV